jgi:hypothetical protein
MMAGSRPPARARAVDTTAADTRIRLELIDAIDRGRAWETEAQAHPEGSPERAACEAEAEWWTLYVAALFGLLTDRWALMTIALGEIDHG